jgi:hypothetical protein
MKKYNLLTNYQDIVIIITSALFADKNGGFLSSVSDIRLERLLNTIYFFKEVGFLNFVVLDNTLPDGFEIDGKLKDVDITLITGERHHNKNVFLSNEYLVNGPSRLETMLLYSSISELIPILKGYKFVMKVSAGYEVRNIKKVLENLNNGIVYRMGNPFRTRIKFCLTSFYILPCDEFINMSNFFYSNFNLISSKTPLEAMMYNFIQTRPHTNHSIDYPCLVGNFLSSGRSSNDLDYKIKEIIFRILSKMGMFACRLT